MSSVCSTDRWSCPTCRAVSVRGTETQEQWEAALRRVQAVHGKRHEKSTALLVASS